MPDLYQRRLSRIKPLSDASCRFAIDEGESGWISGPKRNIGQDDIAEAKNLA